MKVAFTVFYDCPPMAVPDVRQFITDVLESPLRRIRKNTIVYRGIVYSYDMNYTSDTVELIVTSLETLEKCKSFLDELQEIINHQIEAALITGTHIRFESWRDMTV